jgi:NAD(P)-dependent dehydrogenase (short-subunit alcohol dehydrogenase family)
MATAQLPGSTAIVAGASRGSGRGIAAAFTPVVADAADPAVVAGTPDRPVPAPRRC